MSAVSRRGLSMSAVRRCAVGLAAGALCAGLLAGCAAPAPESAPEPAASAAASEPAASSTALDPNRREPADPETLRQLSAAANRAADYWQGCLDEEAAQYLAARVGMAGVVDPAEDTDAAALLDSTGTRARLDSGEASLAKVSFTIEYMPEMNYLGPQYGDGTYSVYILVPADENTACEPVSGWNAADASAAIPELSDEARALKLNEWQHTMLVHQCRALAAAGITDFTDPADWTQEQTALYLAARGQDYGLTGPGWPGANAETANMLLTIDVVPADDWSSNTRYFAADWPGFGDTAPALPETPDYTWEYQSDGKSVTATGSVDGTPAVEYLFAVYGGSDLKYDARTICGSGRSL